jgi:hypothetical protein
MATSGYTISMGAEGLPVAGAYIRSLAEEARRLQHEARCALDEGHYTRASALLGDAELLAEDVHDLVSDSLRRDLGGLEMLAACDVRATEAPAPAPRRAAFALPSRRLRIAIGTSLMLGFALAEY